MVAIFSAFSSQILRVFSAVNFENCKFIIFGKISRNLFSRFGGKIAKINSAKISSAKISYRENFRYAYWKRFMNYDNLDSGKAHSKNNGGSVRPKS